MRPLGCWALLLGLQACSSGESSPELSYTSGYSELDGLQGLIRSTVAVNMVQFQGLSGRVCGIRAGQGYPQLWLRDSATALPALRWLRPRECLGSWLEEHWLRQQPDGQLWDWVDTRGRTKKNTAAADQESSAVLASCEVFRITGDRAWLEQDLGGRPLLERMEDALGFLFERREGQTSGLLSSALTADWGDVSSAYPDRRAVQLDAQTPRVFGLYTNCMAHAAARELAGVWIALGKPERAALWTGRAETLREALQRNLWQEDRGFFRMHLPPGPAQAGSSFDSSDIFALGGNTIAVLSGVATQAQAQRIFDVAAERQRQHGISTVAGVLLPPFPEGFFPHRRLSQRFTYQNGGQWDWFAGRFLLAELRHGRARQATEQLLEIARKDLAGGGLHEWHTPEGAGQGSASYAGSAGALAAAVVEGLYGVELDASGLRLRPRLGLRSGNIRLSQPATGSFVVYRQSVAPDAQGLVLEYESNAAGTGTLGVLLPEGAGVASTAIDGRPVPFETEETGQDRYVVVSTDWRPHRLEVRLAGRSGLDP